MARRPAILDHAQTDQALRAGSGFPRTFQEFQAFLDHRDDFRAFRRHRARGPGESQTACNRQSKQESRAHGNQFREDEFRLIFAKVAAGSRLAPISPDRSPRQTARFSHFTQSRFTLASGPRHIRGGFELPG
jgi:hypothetical protein